jgi:hypothetical protein
MEIVPPPNHCADRRPIFLIYGVRGKPLVKYYEFTSPIRGIEHISHRFVAGLNRSSHPDHLTSPNQKFPLQNHFFIADLST